MTAASEYRSWGLGRVNQISGIVYRFPATIAVSGAFLLGTYCRMLYEKYGSYETVGRPDQLDRRIVKSHLKPAGQHRKPMERGEKETAG